METKLKSVLRNPQLRLGFKSAVFGALLLFAHPLVFLAGGAFLYLKPIFRTFEMIGPFILLTGISLLLAKTTVGGYYFFLSGVYSAVIFYLILGVKDLIFVRRADWHRVLNLALAYGAFLLFFYYSQEFFLAKILTLFFVTLFLLRIFSAIGGSAFGGKKRLVYWLLAFLILEAVWAVSFLPIGFVNSAGIVALVYFTLTDLSLRYLENKLTRRKILTDATIFVLLLLAIFAFSRWSL